MMDGIADTESSLTALEIVYHLHSPAPAWCNKVSHIRRNTPQSASSSAIILDKNHLRKASPHTMSSPMAKMSCSIPFLKGLKQCIPRAVVGAITAAKSQFVVYQIGEP